MEKIKWYARHASLDLDTLRPLSKIKNVASDSEKLNQFVVYLIENCTDLQSGFLPHTWVEMSSSSE